MPFREELWGLVAASQQGVLATVNQDGSPQLTNVLYVPEAQARVIRISTTADRMKGRNLLRDPRAALHVGGEDFWHYAVAAGEVTLSAVAAATGDPATDELFALHSRFYGGADRSAFDEEMIRNRRLVVRLNVSRLYGVMSTAGRRPAGQDS